MIGFNNVNMWNNSVYNQQNYNYYGNYSQNNYFNNFLNSFMMGLLSSLFQNSGLLQNNVQPGISQNVNYNGNGQGINSTNLWNNIGRQNISNSPDANTANYWNQVFGKQSKPAINQNVTYNGNNNGLKATNIWNNFFGFPSNYNQTEVEIKSKEKVFLVGSYKQENYNLGDTIGDFSNDGTKEAKWHSKDDRNDKMLQDLLSKMSEEDKKRKFENGKGYMITESGKVIGTFASHQLVNGEKDAFLSGISNHEKHSEEWLKERYEVTEKENSAFVVTDDLGVTSVDYDDLDKRKDGKAYQEALGGQVNYNGITYDVASTLVRKNTPLILDLKGDGIELTNHKDGVNFDLNADGKTDRTAWTKKGSDDAFLVLDKDGNGQIDSGKELFGDQNGSENGFLELSKYDSNKDGKVDAKDEVYSKLQTWQDKDHDGKVDKGELKSLVDSNIKSISTGFKEETDETGKLKEDEHGNTVGLVGEFEKTDGTKQTMIDALLQNIG